MKKTLLSIILMITAGLFSAVNAQQSLVLTIIETGKDGETSISFDDGEYENDSIDKMNDDDLDMGWEGDDLNIMTTFTRFQNVTIDQGTQIDSAVLVIYAHEDESAEALVTVYAEDVDDSPMFEEDEALADRTMTETSIYWPISDNWTMWEPYHTPNLASVIQDVIDRPGWQSGNSLTLFLKGEDQGASLLDNARDFESFENIEDPDDGGDGLHHPERIPTLKIFYGGATGVKEIALRSSPVSVYPNPVSNGVMHITSTVEANTMVEIFNMNGQKVKDFKNLSGSASLNVSELGNGMYLVRTTLKGVSYNQKVVISK